MIDLSSLSRWVFVRFAVEGFHCWPDAPPHRAYLATRHRHLFHVMVTVAVRHGEREIEFHDLRDWCVAQLPPGDYGAQSCEALALAMAAMLQGPYPGRPVRVEIAEDGECGALIEVMP